VRVRLQQDELARQIRPLVSAFRIESLVQKFVDSLTRTSDFLEGKTIEGDKSEVAIEQLRRRGLIYDLFSYLKQAGPIVSEYLNDKLSKADTQGSEIQFVNREEDLSLADKYAPPYLLFDAPAGYGKTQLLWEIVQRYLLKGWICYSIE